MEKTLANLLLFNKKFWILVPIRFYNNICLFSQNIFMKNIYLIKFIIYGIIGWCLEVTWTGLGSLISGDYRLTSTTSLWMFPIYGLVVCFEPFYDRLLGMPMWVRGVFYMVMIFIAEYVTGGLIRQLTGQCPWDYTGSIFSINGLIRLDYAPVWFVAGLIYERIHVFLQTIIS